MKNRLSFWLIPIFGLIAFAAGHLNLTYLVLFLIALQATFFSPAKYGILPEILPDADLSRANGMLIARSFRSRRAGSCEWRARARSPRDNPRRHDA